MASSMIASSLLAPMESAIGVTFSSTSSHTSTGRIRTAWAILRARHTSTRPSLTASSRRGRLHANTKASLTSDLPAAVERPIAAASGANADQSTGGVQGSSNTSNAACSWASSLGDRSASQPWLTTFCAVGAAA